MASHLEVARRWAERHSPEGRAKRDLAGHHVWMDGDSIFSYGRHFTIARWVTMPNGERVAFFTSRHYSISTTRHQSIVRGAFHRYGGGYQSFTAPDVYDLHGALDWYTAEAAKEFARAARARVYKDTSRADALLAERDRLADLLTRYEVAAA